MSRQRLVAIVVPSLLCVIAAVTALAVLGHGTGSPLGSTLAVGVLSSLLATVIVSAVRVVVVVRSESPSPDALIPAGLVRIKPKKDLTTQEWLQLLQTAKDEFYIAGHSLGRWCAPSTRDEFVDHVRRILDSKGRVTLVMLDPTSQQINRLQQATAVDYTSRIKTSFSVLRELAEQLHPDSLERLKVAVLNDHQALPYMVVGNERRLVTATYLGSSDSDEVACLEFDLPSSAARAVYDDFHELAEAGAEAELPVPAGGSQSRGRKQRLRLNPFRR